MPYLFILCIATMLLACAKEEEKTTPPAQLPTKSETTYGNSKAVTNYLVQVNPFIKSISQLQMDIDKKAVGSSGKATGSNLAKAMKTAKPQLQGLYDKFNQLEPPPLLTGMHKDIKKLMELRLEAYDLTIKGLVLEEQDKDLSLYDEAQIKLQEANQQILALNAQMKKVNQSLVQVAANLPSTIP